MVREFKKTGVATALTGALLAAASMSSHATVQLSAPGDVVLVPYVICDTAKTINTMVGLITFYKERLGLGSGTTADPYWPAPSGLAGISPTNPTPPAVSRSATGRTLHWYFYNSRSEHQLDGIIPVTDNDFVRIDWCSTLTSLNQLTKYSGVQGYMIFVENSLDRSAGVPIPSFALYGHSYQIAGNWATQAFIPVIANPIWSKDASDTLVPNIEKRAGYPAFRRLVAGTDYTDNDLDSRTLQRDVYMRYFLDPSLATENRMVFWFNRNELAASTDAVKWVRSSVPGETYDSEQNYKASFSYPLPNELNVVVSTPTDPAFPGMLHEETETYGGKFTVVNTGIVRFGIPEIESAQPFYGSGVSFNMLGLGAGSNPVQLQTEMATEGEDYLFQ